MLFDTYDGLEYEKQLNLRDPKYIAAYICMKSGFIVIYLIIDL